MRLTGSLLQALDDALPTIDREDIPKATWERWRNRSNQSSVFAAGSLAKAKVFFEKAVALKLIEKTMVRDIMMFFQLLAEIGNGEAAFDEDLLSRLELGDGIIFRLANLEHVRDELFQYQDEDGNEIFTRTNFEVDFNNKISNRKNHHAIDSKSQILDAAFSALDAMGDLEKAVLGANSILNGKKPDAGTDLKVSRELIIVRHKNEAIGLVLQIAECLKLTHESGENMANKIHVAIKTTSADMNKCSRAIQKSLAGE